VLAAALALAAPAHAQGAREAPVGMRRTIEELALPGTELADGDEPSGRYIVRRAPRPTSRW
ncbi:MAG: hypothetical protein KC466_11345, partial [Myxococcales bacterium]|nr:hypothetical protein [Myxococcales bacterium]